MFSSLLIAILTESSSLGSNFGSLFSSASSTLFTSLFSGKMESGREREEREEGRNGTRGKEGKHHAHLSTNPVQYNTSAIVTRRKPFLHYFTQKLLIMYTIPFFSSSAFAWAFNRAFLCLRCLFFSSDADRLPAGEAVASSAHSTNTLVAEYRQSW